MHDICITEEDSNHLIQMRKEYNNILRNLWDPFDRNRPAPSSTYSATSQLLNVDVTALGNLEEYFGYVVKGAQIVGETSLSLIHI